MNQAVLTHKQSHSFPIRWSVHVLATETEAQHGWDFFLFL